MPNTRKVERIVQIRTHIVLALISLMLVSCSSTPKLMPTPNIYLDESGYPEASVPLGLRSNKVDLLFVTDRKPETSSDGSLVYGAGRSASLGFGSAIVEIGKELTWQHLVEMSETSSRQYSPSLRVVLRTELDRFPPTPHAFLVVGGEAKEDPKVRAEYEQVAQQFRQEVNRRMLETEANEVDIFIHGIKNSFDKAAVALAEYWHFIGRRGVPLLYSWPATHSGLFGYFTDRESGEFTIYHLKNLIRLLGSFPEVERINLLAHSRGTDVAISALRELIIEARAAGDDPHKRYRVENLILAAPDLDFDVVRQRIIAEKVGPAFGQLTVYISDTDKALGLSETLMSGTRFGRIHATDLGEQEQAIFSVVKNVAYINVQSTRSFIGHKYFLNNPSTSSDVIRIINTGSIPGEPGRPLTHRMLNFWEMPVNYLDERN